MLTTTYEVHAPRARFLSPTAIGEAEAVPHGEHCHVSAIPNLIPNNNVQTSYLTSDE